MQTRRVVIVSPASDYCQRWTGGTHSWRHTSGGGFDPSRYDVEPMGGDAEAKRYVLAHHYSGTFPSALLRFGLYERGELLGVLVLSAPTQGKVLTNVFPDLEPYEESMELGRLVLADAVPANAESWFIARCFDLAGSAGVRGVVSFADPVPRRINGRLIFPGHVGTTYKASNALYCGRGTARTLRVLPNGSVINARAMQKIRAQERGHEYAERQLIDLGARVLRAGENPATWLNEQLRAITSPVRHAGNHRYVFTLGTRSDRRRVRIAVPSETYPKTRDLEAAA